MQDDHKTPKIKMLISVLGFIAAMITTLICLPEIVKGIGYIEKQMILDQSHLPDVEIKITEQQNHITVYTIIIIMLYVVVAMRCLDGYFSPEKVTDEYLSEVISGTRYITYLAFGVLALVVYRLF